jgi:lactate dehydrogenase-like 2-hydroxyacid dehydrogenase
MAKIVCVLFPDPESGHPTKYARDSIPAITSYPGGQTAPTPQAIDFVPGALLGDVSGELGLRNFLTFQGHSLIVTSDKEETNSVLDQELVDADVLISQPFWPAYLTRERMEKAPKLKLAITAGIGSDHVDLKAAGDVWYPQPALADHPWRTMPFNGMTPHVSGVSLSAQTRYAAGTREILECFFAGWPIREEYLIVDGGKLAGTGARSYSIK